MFFHNIYKRRSIDCFHFYPAKSLNILEMYWLWINPRARYVKFNHRCIITAVSLNDD